MDKPARASSVRAAVALFLLLGVLTGCASQTEKYCSAVKDDNKTLQKLASTSGKSSGDVVGKSLDIFKDLQDKAPHDVTAEWDTFVSAWQGLSDALHSAGVDPSQLEAGKKPAGVSEAQYQAVTGAAEELRSQRVLDAAQGIERHASDVCKVELGGSGLGL